MKAFVGVTDGDWYRQLAATPDLEEANFWQPSGGSAFRALQPGELFLFKLHSPDNYIVGGGVYAHFSLLPVSLAWTAFETSNGASSLENMRQRIEKYRRGKVDPFDDYTIGCILLESPFFLDREHWIPIPPDWKPNIVRGKGYDLTISPGRELFTQVRQAVALNPQPAFDVAIPEPRYGKPQIVQPRLGQGSFQVVVTDAYERRCSMTGERVLPVLEAAHIRPYSKGGEHRTDNGLLLRRDLHTLFDRGYMTVTTESRIEVSRRIRDEFENGREYYALHGHGIRDPVMCQATPSPEMLKWHNENVYRA